MATFQFKNNFNKGINLDLDQTRLPADAAVFIKNLTNNPNINAGAPGGSGSNENVLTPLEGNVALAISGMPSGTNYTIGFYSSEQTNEGYFAVFNSNNNHTVWVIRGDTGQVQKVHQNTLLPFLLDPAYFYGEGRMTLELISTIDPVTQKESNFKILAFTNNNKSQCIIEVEASIATNSYSTAYFTASAAFYNRLELIHLGSVLPIKCVKLNDPNQYSPVPDDANKQNLLINSGWQFRIRTWDIWGRPSEWGIISSVYTSLIGGGCISTSNGLPRCVNLCFDAGSPLIKFITVAYRRGVGNDPSGQVETGWYETETFRKYDDSTGVEWYNRPFNPVFTTAGSGITFNSSTNIITYTFCADKGANPVDSTEAARTEPGLARSSSSIFSINKTLGTANNSYDFEPISQSVIDQIQFSAKPPDPSTVPCPAAPLRTLVVYACIYNAYGDVAGKGFPLIRNQVGGYVTFGDGGNTLGPGDTSCYVSNYKVGQTFADQTNPGFIAYLAGTPFKVIGEWGDLDPATGIFTPNPTFSATGMPHLKMIRFTFVDVPSGKYIMRLASHHAKINDANLQKTSTHVWGICSIGSCYFTNAVRNNCFSNPAKELELDCSVTDLVLSGTGDPMFVILDLNDGVRSNGIDGYLYEQAGGAPVEMAVCYIHGSTMGSVGDAFGSFFTDHNGYYFVTSGSSYCGIDILADLCDGSGMRNVFSITSGCGGSTGKMCHGDGSGARDPDFWGNKGSWTNQVYIARAGGVTLSYPAAAQRPVKQVITICGQPSIGVPGIPVIMTKCQTAMTDSSGTATIIAHNRYNYLASISGTPPFGATNLPDFGSSPGNTDLLIFSQKGGCEWNSCGGCSTAMSNVVVSYIACCPIPPGLCTRITTLPGLSAQPNGIGIKGLPPGGKMPVAFWLHDVIGRHCAPQIRQGELGYVYVPNLNDITYRVMDLCQLQVIIPSGLTVDPVFTHMTILVGDNALYYDFFSWGADFVQYIDNTGVTNTTNPTAIRIYFQSLNEYNKQYNFKTNVGWDFIVQSPGQLSDVVQFIMNGDGTWLPSVKGAPVTYDKAGSFFTIAYQPELAGLQNGCLFQVIRPKQNTTGVDLPYYEQCLTLDVNNGLLPAGTYIIPYQAAYMVSRSIPVPLLLGQPGPVPPGATPVGAVTPAGVTPAFTGTVQYTSSNQNSTIDTLGYSTNNINNNNGVVIFQNVDYQTTFPFLFPGPSSSDLCCSHLISHGRVGIPNTYEQQYRVGTEIAISNPIADKGIVNGMGVFLEANRQVFDRNTWGDITTVLVETSVCLVICDRDHFVIRYNGNQVQLDKNGNLVAQNQYGIFTAPERKAGTNYGCGMQEINTIRKYAGIVRWLDISGYVVIHNFSVADSNTDDAGYLGYMLNKIAIVNIANLTPNTNGITYWTAGIDCKTYEYFLSTHNIPVSGSPSYINTQSQPVLAANETFVFDLKTSILKSFASFTPEYYGIIPTYYLQRQFLSFKNGVPYIHHNNFSNNVAPPPYCNFYGAQTYPRITFVINGVDGKLLPDKVKRFLYQEVYCRQGIPGAVGTFPEALWYADVITSEKGQTSRLLPARWKFVDGLWTAEFLCDLNTPQDPNQPVQTGANVLLDGNPLQGRWAQVSLTIQTSWNGTYMELSEVVSYINLLEKSAD